MLAGYYTMLPEGGTRNKKSDRYTARPSFSAEVFLQHKELRAGPPVVVARLRVARAVSVPPAVPFRPLDLVASERPAAEQTAKRQQDHRPRE